MITTACAALQPAVPGAVVAQWNAELTIAAQGCRSVDGDPVTAETVFDLASVSKLFTTAAVMRLVHAGVVDLDEPLGRWMPWSEPVPTVRQLLAHRSGLQPWQPLYLADDRDPVAVIDSLPRVAGLDERRVYSDLGFILLGELISRACATPLDEAMRELILTPLGLQASYGWGGGDVATSAYDDRVEQHMVRTGEPYPIVVEGDFTRWRSTPITGVANDGNARHRLGGVAGHAGLFASAADLIALGRAFASDDHGLWTLAVVAEFTGATADAEQGLGFRRMMLADGDVMSWHPGFTGTAMGWTADGRVVVMLTNRLLVDAEPVATTVLWRRALVELQLIEEGR